MANFVASDAFGDIIFIGGDVTSSPEPSKSGDELPAKPYKAVFTFPMRSKGISSVSNHGSRPSPTSTGCLAKVAADITATVTLCDAATSGRGLKLEQQVDDTAPCNTVNSKTDTSTDSTYERSTSLDTPSPKLQRDQSRVNTPALPSPMSSYDATASISQLLAQHRSGSCASSGGGALPSSGHSSAHHAVWHNTEWWRSFSSSRLNEMAVEEPDKRSPEMRKVPYVGGAEPMCSLVHGSSGQA